MTPHILMIVLGFSVCAEAQHDYIYFSAQTTIWSYDLNTSTLAAVISSQNRVVGLDFDIADGYLFWTDILSSEILRASLVSGSATGSVKISKASIPDGLAVDWVLNHVYWTDTGSNKVMVCNYDGSGKKTLISSGLDEPRAIALHLKNGYMFWTDWGSSPKIERASMDGSNRITIVTANLLYPNGLYIDYSTDRVYWIDGGRKRIDSSRLDGTDVQNVVAQGHQSFRQPFSVAIYGDQIFFSDWGEDAGYFVEGKGVGKMSIGGVFDDYIYSDTSTTRVYDVKVYDTDIQTNVKTALSSLITLCQQCQGLCLPSEHSADCVTVICTCADGVSCDTTNYTTCSNEPGISTVSSPDARDNDDSSDDDDDSDGGQSRIILIVLILTFSICFALATLKVVLLLRKKFCDSKVIGAFNECSARVEKSDKSDNGLYERPATIRQEPIFFMPSATSGKMDVLGYNLPQMIEPPGIYNSRDKSSSGKTGSKVNLPNKMSIIDLD